MEKAENKKFILLFQKSRCDKKKPFVAKSYNAYMRELFAYGKSVGITYYRSGMDKIDVATGTVSCAWRINEAGDWEVVNDIKADGILNYTSKYKYYKHYANIGTLEGVVPTVNSGHFARELGSKLSQYLVFGDLMSPSAIASNKKDLIEKSKEFSKDDETIVVKPFYGQQGFGVAIGRPSELLKDETITYPVMVQKFVNSNHSLEGTEAKGFIDLRLTFINHKLIYALSRMAEEGSCVTNTSQGGGVTAVRLDQIPQDVLDVAKKFQQKIIGFKHCTYCVDFLFDNGKPVVVEMNTRPSSELLYKTKNKPAIKRNIIATTNQLLDIIN